MPLIPPFNTSTASQAYPTHAHERSGVILENCQNIRPKLIKWLMHGWIPRGKFLTLAGPPATGKTMLVLNFAATISTGGMWPDGTYAEKGIVVIWTGEDGVEDTILPRLIAAGADLTHIRIVRTIREGGRSRSFNPAKDLPALSQAIIDAGEVALLVIDSIAQAISGDSNKNSAVRQSLDPLVNLAETSGCSVLGITHVNKSSKGKEPLDRVNGSLALGAVSRVVYLTAKEPSSGCEGDVQTCVLVRAKSNIESDLDGWRYHIEKVQFESQGAPFTSARIVWHRERVVGSAKDILRQADQPVELGKPSAVDEAAAFLKALLSDGPKGLQEIEACAHQSGVAMSAIKRAKAKLNIASQRQHSGPSSPFLWFLPPELMASDAHNSAPPPGNWMNDGILQTGYSYPPAIDRTQHAAGYVNYGHPSQGIQEFAPIASVASVAPVAPVAPVAHDVGTDLAKQFEQYLKKHPLKSHSTDKTPVDQAMLNWLIQECQKTLAIRYPKFLDEDGFPLNINQIVADQVLDSIGLEDEEKREKYIHALARCGWWEQ